MDSIINPVINPSLLLTLQVTLEHILQLFGQFFCTLSLLFIKPITPQNCMPMFCLLIRAIQFSEAQDLSKHLCISCIQSHKCLYDAQHSTSLILAENLHMAVTPKLDDYQQVMAINWADFVLIFYFLYVKQAFCPVVRQIIKISKLASLIYFRKVENDCIRCKALNILGLFLKISAFALNTFSSYFLLCRICFFLIVQLHLDHLLILTL